MSRRQRSRWAPAPFPGAVLTLPSPPHPVHVPGADTKLVWGKGRELPPLLSSLFPGLGGNCVTGGGGRALAVSMPTQLDGSAGGGGAASTPPNSCTAPKQLHILTQLHPFTHCHAPLPPMFPGTPMEKQNKALRTPEMSDPWAFPLGPAASWHEGLRGPGGSPCPPSAPTPGE